MQQILKISKDHNKDYQIDLASGQRLMIAEDILVEMSLYKGKELTDQEIEELKKRQALNQSYQQVLRYLGYQIRTEQEIKNYLKEKNCPSQGIQRIIEKLKRRQLLDDQGYAESYVRTMMRTSDKGPRTLSQQLKKKGVNDVDIQAGLRLFSDREQQKMALRLAGKILSKKDKYSHQERLQKLKIQLLNKGFTQETIKEVFSELPIEVDEDKEEKILEQLGEKLWQKHQKAGNQQRKVKVTQGLFRKGFNYDKIQQFIVKKEEQEDDNS